MVELVRQVIIGAHEVNGLSNRPMLGRHNHFALHKTTGRIFGIGQRLFRGNPFGILKRIQNRFLLRFLKIFQQVNDIIAFHVPNRLGQNIRVKDIDDFFANGFIQF
jgi:hypothetical protein